LKRGIIKIGIGKIMSIKNGIYIQEKLALTPEAKFRI